MKSSIKIDFTDRGNGMEPVIKVNFTRSEDTRDSLMQAFFESFQGSSRWIRVEWGHIQGPPSEGNQQPVNLYPIKPNDLLETFKEIFTMMPSSRELENELSKMLHLLDKRPGTYTANSEAVTQNEKPVREPGDEHDQFS